MSHLALGAFNPRMYGITLYYSRTEELGAFEEFVSSEELEIVPGASSAPAIEDVAIRSVIDHETRHFHDFLLSPFGNLVFAKRAQATANGVQALRMIRDMDGGILPVPLSRWADLPESEKRGFLQDTGYEGEAASQTLKALAQFGGSVAGPDGIVPALCAGTLAAYQSLDDVRKAHDYGIGINLSSDHVFEGVAHLVQCQAIWTSQGAEEANAFANTLFTSGAPCLTGLEILFGLSRQNGIPVNIGRMCALLSWCLFTDLNSGASAASPAMRLAILFQLIAAMPDLLEPGAFAEEQVWDRLDELSQLRPWRNVLESIRDGRDRSIRIYTEASQEAGLHIPLIAKIYRQFASDQDRLIEAVTHQPGLMANPLTYITADPDALPLPLVETRFLEFSQSVPDMEPGSRSIPLFIDEAESLIHGWLQPLDPGMSLDVANTMQDLRRLHHWVDLAFFESGIGDWLDDAESVLLSRFVGKKLLHVI